MKKILVCVIVLSIVLLSGCGIGYSSLKTLTGNRNVEKVVEELSEGEYELVIKDVHFVSSSGAASIVIDEDLAGELALTTDKNISETIEITVDDDAKTILIKGDKNYRYKYTEFVIEIGRPVNSVRIDGGYSLDFKLPSISDFAMVVNGAVAGTLNFSELESFSLEINGASELTLLGSAVQSTAKINGASNISAFNFIAENATVNIRGASNYQVHATETLDATIDGVGTITYDGSPDTLNRQIKGLGRINPRN